MNDLEIFYFFFGGGFVFQNILLIPEDFFKLPVTFAFFYVTNFYLLTVIVKLT